MTIYVNARAIIERENGEETEILLQVRSRPGEPERWELPGGQIESFESVYEALKREIAEETGLQIHVVSDEHSQLLHQSDDATVETFEPFFAYQTVNGPVDSLGFYFRCSAHGELTEVGDNAKRPTWFGIQNLEHRFEDDREQFDWLTQAALGRYLDWKRSQGNR
jgi:8-oxo-dGTP diphosphatase